jgi:GDP-mannose 6-dehydrogenase
VVHALFGRFADRLHWITFREAELLKPVCNAFHALKVAFANEVGSLCSSLGINGQALMRLVAADRKLNISPAYLRPGLPFGGSCLPKDLRMVVQLADSEKMKVPLLRGVLASNETHKERLLDALPVNGYRRLGLEGLAFKPGTDDLRDSPLVPLAYRLISKGYEVKIFDPAMAALRRMGMRHYYLEQHHPLLANHLVESAEELLGHAELLVLTQERGELRTKVRQLANPPHIVDLTVTGPGADRRSPSDSRDEMRQRPAA